MFRRALSMCPINFVFMLCKVKKQAFSGYYIMLYNAKTLASHLKIVFIIIPWFLNTEITRGHSWSLVVIRDHSWSFVVTRGHSWSLVVTRGHSWSLVVTRGHSWSFVVSRGHSWSLVCTFRQDHILLHLRELTIFSTLKWLCFIVYLYYSK
jgi:hypothetical protein